MAVEDKKLEGVRLDRRWREELPQSTFRELSNVRSNCSRSR